jgi:hypothetical protein
MVTVYQIDPDKCTPLRPKRDWVWWSCIVVIIFQLFIAAIPWIWSVFGQERNWSIFLVTACGNALPILTASLSGQVNNRPGRQKSGSNMTKRVGRLSRRKGFAERSL